MKTSSKVAIFPGSFDPFTIGHQQIVEQSLDLFDEVIIAIGQSATKVPLLSTELRLEALRETFAQSKRVKAEAFSGLVVDFARQRGARFLIRGLRNETDLAFELPMAHTNRCLASDIQTVFLPTSPERAFISSTLVREIAKHRGDFAAFVPESFARRMKAAHP
ncbi:MAG: pantetheine-phosphate adenylyltransferase [Pseudobdellovibrionaceae bacterium]|uniref:pantetheine-phosphate adenylyltransferase n=1 Tax=Oligoflexus sp. TaxID=1971216 RepID=UPI0027CD7A8E|nr:pantetheine-phosphate adenylyltransferase [Oligoflexus sp.]MDQ3235004.1 pantetheine-phosphate adenylyltransferase [Pseudobdellovibrionaceae bacterium]HYX35556.1 pantetheine-phosphate adenylyltransferase [Oligoflexus sp.]